MNACTACCCGPCRPRYKRLVDQIFPVDASERLVKANMQKLTFYAISHPEKLDRIGEYLTYRLSRDIYRQRTGLVRVSAEAMDQLLAACHGSPSLNLFVESFLKMITKLLETQDHSLEALATESFVNFSNMEEVMPSYHRRYDFFIEKFSSMAHNNHTDTRVRQSLRLAGLKGLRGVVRKTVSDDLQANIWDKQFMEMIVPSLLYNMHDTSCDPSLLSLSQTLPSDQAKSVVLQSDTTDSAEDCPKILADSCLRELIGKASFGSLKSVLSPVLLHCDSHDLWVETEFVITCFQAIMYSIQAQYSYAVIQALIGHLDGHSQDGCDLRMGIGRVLRETVAIAANSIGPGVLEIFNSLLRHLRGSVEIQLTPECVSAEKEQLFQEILINTLADFANSLPDYQKVEIMMFIIGKVPLETGGRRADVFLQHVLVKTLLKVATKYRTGNLATVMTSTFLEPLLRLALVQDASVRLMVQKILHTLLDRHENLSIVEHAPYAEEVTELMLTVEKCSRADQMFMKKCGAAIYSTMYKAACAQANTIKNYDAILCTLLLLCIEVGCDEVLVELYRLLLGIQSSANDFGVAMMATDRAALHNLVAKFMNISSQLTAIPALCQHVHGVIKTRAQQAHPAFNVINEMELYRLTNDAQGMELNENMLFHCNNIAEALVASGKDASRLSAPFTPRDRDGLGMSPTNQVDAGSISLDINSIDSTPSVSRKPSRRNTGLLLHNAKDDRPLTVDKLRVIVAQPIDQIEQEDEERCRELIKAYRTKPFREIVESMRPEYTYDTMDHIQKIMARVDEKNISAHNKPASIYDIELPPLFVY